MAIDAKRWGKKKETPFGVDLDMLRFNLSLTPTQRIERQLKMAKTIQEIRGLAKRSRA